MIWEDGSPGGWGSEREMERKRRGLRRCLRGVVGGFYKYDREMGKGGRGRERNQNSMMDSSRAS